MTNVYIIDDHPAIIEGLKNMLDDNDDNINVIGSSLYSKKTGLQQNQA